MLIATFLSTAFFTSQLSLPNNHFSLDFSQKTVTQVIKVIPTITPTVTQTAIQILTSTPTPTPKPSSLDVELVIPTFTPDPTVAATPIPTPSPILNPPGPNYLQLCLDKNDLPNSHQDFIESILVVKNIVSNLNENLEQNENSNQNEDLTQQVNLDRSENQDQVEQNKQGEVLLAFDPSIFTYLLDTNSNNSSLDDPAIILPQEETSICQEIVIDLNLFNFFPQLNFSPLQNSLNFLNIANSPWSARQSNYLNTWPTNVQRDNFDKIDNLLLLRESDQSLTVMFDFSGSQQQASRFFLTCLTADKTILDSKLLSRDDYFLWPNYLFKDFFGQQKTLIFNLDNFECQEKIAVYSQNQAGLYSDLVDGAIVNLSDLNLTDLNLSENLL